MMYRRRAAFTLIEALAAIVIFLIFMASVVSIHSAANAAIARTKDQQEVYQTARVLLAQLTAELTSAYQLSTVKLSPYGGVTLAGTALCSLQGTVANDATALPQATLTFITSAHPAPAGVVNGGLCQVTYEMAGDGSVASPIGLYIMEDYYPGVEMATQTVTPRLISPRVSAFNCLYLASDGVTWSNTWDATAQTALPVAVRVELTLQSRDPKATPIVFSATANLQTATAPTVTPTTTDTSGGSNATP